MEREFDLYVFDLDHTLVKPIVGAGKDKVFRKGAADWQLLPGRRERILALKAAGAKIAIATNQGGVAINLYGAWPKGEAAMNAEVRRAAYEVRADYVGICFSLPSDKADPHYRNFNDFDRKPNPGLILKAMVECQVGPRRTIMIGDSDSDGLAAEDAGCAFALADEFFAEKEEVAV